MVTVAPLLVVLALPMVALASLLVVLALPMVALAYLLVVLALPCLCSLCEVEQLNNTDPTMNLYLLHRQSRTRCIPLRCIGILPITLSVAACLFDKV